MPRHNCSTRGRLAVQPKRRSGSGESALRIGRKTLAVMARWFTSIVGFLDYMAGGFERLHDGWEHERKYVPGLFDSEDDSDEDSDEDKSD